MAPDRIPVPSLEDSEPVIHQELIRIGPSLARFSYELTKGHHKARWSK